MMLALPQMPSFLTDHQPLLGWCVTALVTTAVSASIMYFSSSKKKKSLVSAHGGRELPPMTTLSTFEVAAGLFSFQAPFFFLEIVRSMKQPVLRLPLPPSFVICADYKTARLILEDPASTKWRKGYRFFDLVTGGDTFFSSEGHRYKHARKSTSIAFAAQHVTRMVECIEQVLKEWIKTVLVPLIDGDIPVDISEELQRVTVQAIGKVAFDYDFSTQERDNILESLKTCYQEFAVHTPKNPLRDTALFGWMFQGVRQARSASSQLRRTCRTMMEEHRNLRSDDDETSSRNPNTILSLIHDDPEYRSDYERISDMIAFLVGGYDTVSYTISWTLLELARNPEVQTELRTQLRRCQSSVERRQSSALKHVVKESMRLHPTAALGSLRQTGTDIMVPDTNYYIPAGTIVDMPFFCIHRDERVYERPDEFLPQRWENASEEQLKAFLGFAAGRRNCQGQSLANAELSVILAELCSNYEWTVVDEGKVEYFVTLKTVGTMLAATKVE